MNQVHKETLTSVDNSLPNRQGLEVEVFGTEGIPDDVRQAHDQRIIAAYYQAEAERRAATGNPAPGGAQGGQAKKPKFESPADLKKRLAEHKAKKAEQAANGGSGGNTPLEGMVQSPMGQSPGAYVSVTPPLALLPADKISQNGSPYAPPQATYGAPPSAGYGSFSQEHGAQPPATYQQPYNPPYSGPPGPQYQQYPPPQQGPPQPSFPPSGYQPPQNYGAPAYAAGPAPGSFSNGPSTHTPPAYGGLPNRPPSLPPAPGIAQRPPFGAGLPAPPHQAHQNSPATYGSPGGWGGGGWNGQNQNSAMSSVPPSQGYGGSYSTNAAVNDLVSGAAREADDIDEIIRLAEAGIFHPKKTETAHQPPSATATPAEATPTPAPETAEKTEVTEKKLKKDKPMKMVYSDNDVSPEEKMALMPRYAFVPEGKAEAAPAETSAPPAPVGIVGA